MNYLLSFLADPQSASKLARAYQVFRRDWREKPADKNGRKGRAEGAGEEGQPALESKEPVETPAYTTGQLLTKVNLLLRKMENVEDFVAPHQADRWLAAVSESEPEQVVQELATFRVAVRRWLAAVMLPIDQVVLTLAQDVFTSAPDLALAHKLAIVLRQAADEHPDWRLPELTSELAVIAKNERRFIGFSTDDSGFDPERYRGKVVVTTMHKAKGLEWDRVYLMSVNNYDFPSNMPNDRFISEKWFIRGGLNLEAEALAQLTALQSGSEYEWYGSAVLAWRRAQHRRRGSRPGAPAHRA